MSKKTKVPPGTWIEREMFESKAFLALNGFAPQLLILFLAKRRFEIHGKPGKEKRTCVNRDSIHFTYIEAQKKYGITIPRLSRAIDDLLAKGFIKVKYQGGACQSDKSIYELSDNWRLWRPGGVFETRQADFVERGFRKPKKQK